MFYFRVFKVSVAYRITPELRTKLKDPFGILIQGTPQETIAKVKQIVDRNKPTKIISVGDVISRNLHKNLFNPQLSIVDNISMRTQRMPPEPPVEKTVCVKNPPGTITKEAISAVKEALAANKHTHIVVDGEEDLLTLIAVQYAPVKTLVIYGQPLVGVVAVKVTLERKALAEQFLNMMKAAKS
jgi:uncharacterized protein (UPF0218 family)